MAFWLFQNLVVIAVLAAVVLVVCRVTRIGPVAKHALWVLVLLKFVTPPVVAWPWAAPDPLGLESTSGVVSSNLTTPGVISLHLTTPGVDSPETTPEVVLTTHAAASVWPWLLGIWMTGGLMLLGIEGVRLWRLGRRIRTARRVDPAVVDRVAEISARLGIQPPPVLGMDGLPSPLVWCLGRPRLLWPAHLEADASDACIDGLLVHELAHVKRRDHFVGWLELAAGVVWWWNPLFWYVRSARREQAELACDAWVIDALPNGRRAYAESLLALSIGLKFPSPASVLGVRAATRRALERRLVMIMKGRASLRLPWVGLISLALLAAMTLPAWATSPEQTTPVPTTQAQTPPPAVPAVAKPATQTPPPAKATTVEAPVIRRAVRSTQPTPSVERTVVVEPGQAKSNRVRVFGANLPADGQDLLKGFEADQEAIYAEADKKVEARREALAKAMQDLQDRYTKAGKLDEAVAIRDYIKAGLPGAGKRYSLWFKR